MYTINVKVTVNWTLYSKVATPSLEDLSILLKAPGCNSGIKYTVEEENYTVPTFNKLGFITFNFTPDIKGLWEVSLLVSNTEIKAQNIFVQDPDSKTTKFIRNSCLP